MTIEKLSLSNPFVVNNKRPFNLRDMLHLTQGARTETLKPGSIHVLENDFGTATIYPYVDLDGEVRAHIELKSKDGTPIHYKDAKDMTRIDGYGSRICLGTDIMMFFHGKWKGTGESEELVAETIIVYKREQSRDLGFYLFGRSTFVSGF